MNDFVRDIVGMIEAAPVSEREKKEALARAEEEYGRRYWKLLDASFGGADADDDPSETGGVEEVLHELAILEDELLLDESGDIASDDATARIIEAFGRQGMRYSPVYASEKWDAPDISFEESRMSLASEFTQRKAMLERECEDAVSECRERIARMCAKLGCTEAELSAAGGESVDPGDPEEVFSFWVEMPQIANMLVPYTSSPKAPIPFAFKGESDRCAFAACQCITASWLRSFRKAEVKVVWLDPVSMGRSLGKLSEFAHAPEAAQHFTCAFTADDIKAEIGDLIEEMTDRGISLSSNRSFWEYKRIQGEKERMPYIVLVALGLDRNAYEDDALDLFRALAANSSEFGVQLVLGVGSDDSISVEKREKIDVLLRCCQRVEEREFRLQTCLLDSWLNVRVPEESWWSGAIEHIRDSWKQQIEQGQGSATQISIPFAKDDSGNEVYLNFGTEFVHAMAIGSPGSGKSVFLHNVISSACSRYSPRDLELWLIDYKKTEFGIYGKDEYRFPHIKVLGLDYSLDFVKGFIDYLAEEFERRQKIVFESGAADIVQYNEESDDENRLPYLMVVIDEFHRQSSLMHDEGAYLSRAFEEILRESRSYGMYLLMADQTLSGLNGLTPAARMQIGGRILFRWTEPSDYQGMFGEVGVELKRPLERGEAYVRVGGQIRRCESRFVDRSHIRESRSMWNAWPGSEKLIYRESRERAKVDTRMLGSVMPGSLLLGTTTNFIDPLFVVRKGGSGNCFVLATVPEPALLIAVAIILNESIVYGKKTVVVSLGDDYLHSQGRDLMDRISSVADIEHLHTMEEICAFFDGEVEDALVVMLNFESIALMMSELPQKDKAGASRARSFMPFKTVSPSSFGLEAGGMEGEGAPESVVGSDGVGDGRIGSPSSASTFDARSEVLELIRKGSRANVSVCWVSDVILNETQVFPSAILDRVSLDQLFPHRFATSCQLDDSVRLGMKTVASSIDGNDRERKAVYVGRTGKPVEFKPFEYTDTGEDGMEEADE